MNVCVCPSVCVPLHVNADPVPETAYWGLSSLIPEILSKFNEWCKIGTYVSLF